MADRKRPQAREQMLYPGVVVRGDMIIMKPTQRSAGSVVRRDDYPQDLSLDSVDKSVDLDKKLVKNHYKSSI